MITQPQVFRSLASAVLLTLYDKSPEDDWAEFATFPISADSRPMLVDDVSQITQELPMLSGPTTAFLVPGIVVEFGMETNTRGNCKCPVIVSIARTLTESLLREQTNIARLADKLNPMIFGTPASSPKVKKRCPIYEFVADQHAISGIVSAVDWNDELLDTSPPRAGFVGNYEQGGWLRLEMTFTAFYRI